MRTEIKTVRVKCDACSWEVIVQLDEDMPGIIPGWEDYNSLQDHELRRIGLEYNPGRHKIELCPYCVKKLGK